MAGLEARGAIAGLEAWEAMADPGLREAMADPGLREAMADPGLREAMADPGTREAMADPGLRETMADPGTRETMADPGTREAMAEQETWPLFSQVANVGQGAPWPWLWARPPRQRIYSPPPQNHVIPSYSTKTPKGTCLSAFGGSGEAAGGGTIFAVGGGIIIAAGDGTFIAASGGTIFTAGGSRLRIPEPPLRGTNISRFLISVGSSFLYWSVFLLRYVAVESCARRRIRQKEYF